MSQQHSHSTTPFSQKQFPIQILCDGMQSPANMGALFRIADAFGIEQIVFSGVQVPITSSRLRRTSRQTEKKIPFSEVDHPMDTIKRLKKEGYLVLALEITEESIPIQEFKAIQQQKVVLVLGNEKKGILAEILAVCDHHLHIEMFGENSSMNVVQAASIALYTFINN